MLLCFYVKNSKYNNSSSRICYKGAPAGWAYSLQLLSCIVGNLASSFQSLYTWSKECLPYFQTLPFPCEFLTKWALQKNNFSSPTLFHKERFLKCFSWKTFFHFVWRTCKNHLFLYMKRKMWPGKENHSHKNSLSFTHGNKNSPITFFFITTWFHTFCSQVINTGEKNYLGQT